MSQRGHKADDNVTLGGGFLQSQGKRGDFRVRVEADELTYADIVPERAKGEGGGRKTKLAAFGLSPALVRKGSPEYARCLYQANKYRRLRQKELSDLHGHLSAGVSTFISSASLALACSRYLYERAAEVGDIALIKLASQLAESGQRHELAAYELAAREGRAKRMQEASREVQPWLVTAATGSGTPQDQRGLRSDGEPKQRPGRKTNEERAEAESMTDSHRAWSGPSSEED